MSRLHASLSETISLLRRYVHEKYPGVRVFHEDRPDIPEGVEVWHPGTLFSCIMLSLADLGRVSLPSVTGYVDKYSISQLTWNPCCPG